MKKLFTLLFAGAMTIVAFGQTALSPNPVLVENLDSDEFEAVAYSFVTNESSEEIEYTWTRNTIEITEGWSTAVCDLNQCYLSMVSSQDFILSAGLTGNLDVHLYPAGIDGYALIEVTIEDNDNEENSVTGVYLFSSGSLSAPERINNALKIYPNPVQSDFFIDGGEAVERIEIYSVSGKLVKEVNLQGRNAVNVNDLQSGNYIVRMWDQSNSQISTNVLSIQ